VIQICGHKLNLRDVQPKDTDLLVDWLNPRHEWHKFNGPYYTPKPADEISGLVKGWLSPNLDEIRRRLIIVDARTDVLIGNVSRYWISKETNWLAIGLAIYDSQQWSKGYGYEALGLWCDYLFTSDEQLVRLDLRTWSGNIGMIKLAEKLSFAREATFRNARIVDGVYYDGLGYGILREEWEQLYPTGFTAHITQHLG
jgi:RimJ/RimL family protein N-acetyltransferase